MPFYDGRRDKMLSRWPGHKFKFGPMDIALNTISNEPISMNQILVQPILMNQISVEHGSMKQNCDEHGSMN